MRPRRTPQTDVVFHLREGNEDNDLWIERYQDPSGRHAMASFWELDDEERAAIAAGGMLELFVWGTGHPPVAIGVGPSLEERRG